MDVSENAFIAVEKRKGTDTSQDQIELFSTSASLDRFVRDKPHACSKLSCVRDRDRSLLPVFMTAATESAYS